MPTAIRAENAFHYYHSDRRVILIHGFRNDETDAVENFRRFRRQADLVSQQFQLDMFGFTWPGDDIPWNIINLFKANVRNAEECARRLADFLDEMLRHMPPQREVVLVAHSLGCYLVIEALRELDRRGALMGERIKVYLMAAAFPEDLLNDGTPHAKALQQVARRRLFYSTADGVLKHLFPAGGLWSVEPAAGLHGTPQANVWSQAPDHALQFGHSDYWRDEEGHICTRIARDIGYRGVAKPQAFGRGNVRQSTIQARPPLPERRI